MTPTMLDIVASIAAYLGVFAVIATALRRIFVDPSTESVQASLLRARLQLHTLEAAIADDELTRRGRRLGVLSPHTRHRYGSRGKPWGHGREGRRPR